MEPITVRFNGLATVDDIVETPDPSMTAGEYLQAILEAHDVNVAVGDEAELLMPDGEPVPDDLDVALLSGTTVNLRVVRAPAQADAAPIVAAPVVDLAPDLDPTPGETDADRNV